MGDSGLAYKVGTLFSCTDDLHTKGILQGVRIGDCPIIWSVGIYSIRSGSQVYDSFLEKFQESHGDAVDDEHRFSSPDRRSIRDDHPDFREHATGMRPRPQGWSGRALNLIGICL